MRAFIIDEFGQPGAITERPKPEAGEGELLVRVKAAGINAMDPVIRAGWAKDFMEHRLPLTPGLDYAGTVEAVGPGVEGFEVGDEVFGGVAKPYFGEGAFAEYVTVSAAVAAKRPATLSPEQAAALSQAGTTALAAVDALGAGAGDTIAVIGAGGGVGSFATQLASDRGTRVIAVTRGDNAAYVRELGAADVVDYTVGHVADQLRAREPEGLVGIIDAASDAPTAAALAPTVRPGGKIVAAAAMGLDKALAGQAVTGQLVGAAPQRVGELGELVSDGLRVEVETLPLEFAAEALDRQAAKQVRGKLVLVMDEAA